jgi:hypothetical protein
MPRLKLLQTMLSISLPNTTVLQGESVFTKQPFLSFEAQVCVEECPAPRNSTHIKRKKKDLQENNVLLAHICPP